MVPFAAGPAGEPWGLWQWDVAVASAGKAVEEGAPTPLTTADIEKAVATGEGGFYRALVADLAAARREYDALSSTLDRLCGSVDSPPGHNIRAALSKYDDTIRALARLHLAAAPTAEEAGGDTAGGAAGGSGGGVHKGPIQTREDAFRLLESVSDYFRRTEPHSPLSYSLEQCVRWGRMPLPDLLAELVPDEMTRAQLFKLTGIRPPAPPPAPQ
jgi:type VI secretion system protein ImpA